MIFHFWDELKGCLIQQTALLILKCLLINGFEIPPSFVNQPPSEIIHSPGRPLHIPCSAVGYPEIRYEWYINGELLPIGRPLRKDIQLTISSRRKSQFSSTKPEELLWDFTGLFQSGRLANGHLHCIAANLRGRALSAPTDFLIAEIDESKPCETQTLSIRDQTYVQCNCTVPRSIPPATIRWMYRNEDGSMGFIQENRTFAMDDAGNLHVSTAFLPKSTVLTLFCSASNSFLRTMRTGCDYVLTIKKSRFNIPRSPVLFAKSPSKTIRLVNSSVELRCLISASKDTQIAWFWKSDVYDTVLALQGGQWTLKDERKLPIDPTVELKNEDTILSLSRITYQHRGTYSCQSFDKNGFSSQPISAEFELIIESAPTFSVKPVDITVPIGGKAELTCEPSTMTRPEAVVTWLVNGDSISRYLDGERKRLKGNQLIITDLTIDDIAVFQCNISNRHGFRFTNAYVNVWNSPPVILDGPVDKLVVAEGSIVEIPCKAYGAPKAAVVWSINGKSLIGVTKTVHARQHITNQRMVTLSNTNLLLTKVTSTDEGVYKCVASNPYGSSSSSGSLLVRQKTRLVGGHPLLVGNPTAVEKTHGSGNIIKAREGSELTLVCRAETDILEAAHLSIEWRWRGLDKTASTENQVSQDINREFGKLPDGNFNHIQRKVGRHSAESTLTLKHTKPAYSGHYECLARSKLDNDSHHVTLLIEGPPDPPVSLKLVCYHDSRERTAVLFWSSGLDNNSPISDVRIEYAVGYYRPLYPHSLKKTTNYAKIGLENLQTAVNTHQWSTMKHQLTDTSNHEDVVIVNLTAGTARIAMAPDVAYQFRVLLVNEIGVSEASSLAPGLDKEVQEACLFPAEIPKVKPTHVQVYGNAPNTLTVKWEGISPLRHNGPGLQSHITLVCLNCVNNGGPKETTISNWNQSEVTFSAFHLRDSSTTSHWPIEVFKQYQVTITTSNVMGYSKAEPLVIIGWSGEGEPTIAPENLQIRGVNASSVDLIWDWSKTHDTDQGLNGFFVGLKIEWCFSEKPPDLCDRYKVVQNVILNKPSKDLLPNLRRQTPKTNEIALVDNSVSWLEPSSMALMRSLKYREDVDFNMYRTATVHDLPGLSSMRIWVRLLNIQYQGPKSESILVHTKEGTPGAVSAFTHSFAGVNYVEVAWAKPTQTNGVLTGYTIDVMTGISMNKYINHQPASSNSDGLVLLYQKKIVDPDQMGSRLTGLDLNTVYKLIIRAETSVGSGTPRELIIQTAKLRSAKSPAEFIVSPIYGSTTTLNVSLVQPPTGTALNDEERVGRIISPQDSSTSRSLLNNVPRKDEGKADSFDQIQLDQTPLRAFLVQFKRVEDEHWEETDKEFDKIWLVVGSLIPGKEYDMRIVLARTPSLSYVSPVRMLRVPRPGEIGFGLSNAQFKLQSTPTGSADISLASSNIFHSLFNSSLAVKVFIPLIVSIIIIVMITTIVCCVRGQVVKRSPLVPSRQTYAPVSEAFTSSSSPVYMGFYKGKNRSGIGLRLQSFVEKGNLDDGDDLKITTQTINQTFQNTPASPRMGEHKMPIYYEPPRQDTPDFIQNENVMYVHNGSYGGLNILSQDTIGSANEQTNVQHPGEAKDGQVKSMWVGAMTSPVDMCTLRTFQHKNHHKQQPSSSSFLLSLDSNQPTSTFAPTRCLSPSFTLVPPLVTQLSAWPGTNNRMAKD